MAKPHLYALRMFALWALTLLLTALPAAKSEGQLVIVNNLPNAATNSLGITYDFWRANEFTVGSTDARFGNVTISLASADPVNPLVVQLWSGNTTRPTALIATLSGANPTTGGNYTFSATSSITLSALTPYWVVLSTSSSFSATDYEWNSTSDLSTTGPGTLDGYNSATASGTLWLTHVTSSNFMMSVSVPEPAAYGLIFGMGILAWGAWRSSVRKNLRESQYA